MYIFLISEVASIVKHQIIKHGSNTTLLVVKKLDSWSNSPPSSSDVVEQPWNGRSCHLHVHQWMAGLCLTYVTLHSPTPKTPKPQLVSHVLLILYQQKLVFTWAILKSHLQITSATFTSQIQSCWSLKVTKVTCQIWTTIHSNCCWETKVDQ